MPILISQQAIADLHNIKYPSNAVFNFCPWCGAEREEEKYMEESPNGRAVDC